MKKLQESQIVRYIMTGGITTAINYVIYFALVAASVNYIAANCTAWLGAVTFAFFANRQIVFCSKAVSYTHLDVYKRQKHTILYI